MNIVFRSFLKNIEIKSFLFQARKILATIIAISYLFFLVGETYRASTHHSIINTFDDDAGDAIKTTEKTKFYNSNGWFHYGTTYYKVARTFFESLKIFHKDLNQKEFERYIHFSLLITSLISLF